MKKLPWILIVLLLIACVAAWFRPHEQSPAEEIGRASCRERV